MKKGNSSQTPQEKVRFRETGNSLLMGLVKITPGEFANYHHELNAAITNWQASRDSEPKPNTEKNEVRTWSNPKHFYQTCAYSTLGSWDLAHFTLTYDQGIATSLPYIGHAIGQQLYFLHDVSLQLPVEMVEKQIDKEGTFVKLLERFKITYCFRHNGDGQYETDPKYKAVRKLISGRGKYHYGVITQKFDLESVYNGYIFGDMSSISGRSLVWTRRKREEAEKQIFRKSGKDLMRDICPEDPIGIFQLNINPNFTLECTEENRVLIYLFLLYKINKYWEKDDDISFIKPFLTDNFFDFVILFRGKNFTKMNEIVTEITKITEEDVEGLCKLTCYNDKELYSKDPTVEKFVKKKPLYHLSYNIEGFSYPQIIDIQERIEKSFLAASKSCKSECGFEKAVSKSSEPKCEFEKLSKCVAKVLKEEWDRHAPNNSAENESSNNVVPSILLAVQTGLNDHILALLNIWSAQCCRVISLESQPVINKVQGRYSFKIHFGDEGLPLKKFVVCYAFLTFFLSKECANKLSLLKTLPIETRKIHNPILQFKTKFHYGQNNNDQQRSSNSSLNIPAISDSPYHGHVCLLNRVKMTQICYDSLDSLMNRLEEVKGEDDIQNLFPSTTDYAKIEIEQKRKIVNKITSSLHYSLKSIVEVEHQCPFQWAFNNFLKKKFAGFVTPDTLELLFSTLCAVDSFLSNQISYYFYLDVRIFTIEFLSKLLSAYRMDFGNKYCFFYWDQISQTVKRCNEDQNDIMQEVEKTLINFISTIGKITSQKLSGAYPQHDRNFSRLSDIRVFQNKKIQAVSWMINSLTQEFLEDCSNTLKTPPKGGIPRYLPLFGNSPDMIMCGDTQTVEINVRNLASIEGLSLITHEVGHIFCEFLKQQRSKHKAWLSFYKENHSPPPTSIKEKNVVSVKINNALDPNDSLSSSKANHPSPPTNINEKKEKSVLSIKVTNTLDQNDPLSIPNPKQYGKHLDCYFFHRVSIFDEVFADLYSFYVTFGPLEMFYHSDFEHLCPNVDSEGGNITRTDEYKSLEKGETKKYDRIDDFALSFIAQIIHFPQIINQDSLYHLFIRLTVMIGISKYVNNKKRLHEKTGISSEKELYAPSHDEMRYKVAANVYDYLIQPFFDEKLINLLEKLATREKEINLQPLILDKTLKVLKELKPSSTEGKAQSPSENEELYVFFQNHIKRIFQNYFNLFIRGISVDDPMFIYIQKYAEAKTNTKETKKIYRNTYDAYLVRQGIYPNDIEELDALDCFYQSLQLCGTINLRFGIISIDKHLIMEGYQGFKTHAAQQYLSRTRQMATTILWHGALQAINKEIVKINKDYKEWWQNDPDSNIKTLAKNKQKEVKELLDKCEPVTPV